MSITRTRELIMNNDSGTTRPPSVWPTFQAKDAPAMIKFLVDVVGFVETARYDDGDQVAHCQLDWPEGGGVMFGSHKPDLPWTVAPGTAGIYVVSNQVDEVYERVRASGVEILREPDDTDYGSREFGFADPEGNLWSIGTYAGEPAPTN
ncbi:VOC family protein [Propionibacteriaceae bacterium Y1700]|uniref:VOC family protein n=1 Tax=Microlunatus sp. Y1700 TaxID=3418487 RepID=UPI003DA73428